MIPGLIQASPSPWNITVGRPFPSTGSNVSSSYGPKAPGVGLMIVCEEIAPNKKLYFLILFII